MAAIRRQAAGLPLVVLTTSLVIGIPLAILWALSSTETVDSLAVLTLVAVVLAFAITRAGEAVSRRFGRQLNELMAWGWLRGVIYERRLDRAWAEINSRRELGTGEMAEQFRELSDALEAADGYTSGHSRRVAAYCERIGRHLGLDDSQISHLRIAAAVHDVGKVNTPAEILRKPARLTEAEFRMIKQHPVDGAVMVAKLADPDLTSAVRYHHERIDGSGYPEGLVATEIPIEARIIAVADTFDAITSNRPYRPARSRYAALEILQAEAGTKLDADAVRALNTRSLNAWSALTSVPERGVAAMGGALNTLSASTAAAIVAGIAVIGIGVANPGSVASVIKATPIPGVIDAVVPGGGDKDEKEGPSKDEKPVRLAATGAIAATVPVVPVGAAAPTVEPAPANDGGSGGTGEPGAGEPSAPSEPTGPPEPSEPEPPAEPKPPPEPPQPPVREPELLDPVTDVLPAPLGNTLKGLTDPLLPPR